MRTVHRFLVAAVVPALIVSIFAVSAAAAHGPSGKVELCHWASHKFVKISVSMNAEPAHLGHGDVMPDEYGDCAAAQAGSEQEQEDSSRPEGARVKSGHSTSGWGSSSKGSGGSEHANGD